MEGLELICFKIISYVGSARSHFIEAIQEAKNGNIELARNMVVIGNEELVQGHHSHFELLKLEANGEKIEFQLLLVHAEDQLMSAEAFEIICREFIDLYERIIK